MESSPVVTMNFKETDVYVYQETLKCLQDIARQVHENCDNVTLLDLMHDRCVGHITQLRQRSSNALIAKSLESQLESMAALRTLLHHQGDYSEPSITSKKTNNSSDDDNHRVSRQSAVRDMLVLPSSNNGRLMDVVGLDQVKEVLSEAFILPTQCPHLFTGGARPWKRILMYGPPGTGKTKLAMALAAELEAPFYCVSMANLLSSWIGESEKILRELFNDARQQAGVSVIFFDEIDCLCRSRSNNEDESTRRLKTELLRQIEGSSDTADDKIFLLATTNCPWDLDTAFIRRFQQRIFIPLPDRQSRRHIIEQHFRGDILPLTDQEWTQLLEMTEGYSGADLQHLSLATAYLPIRELQSSSFWQFTSHSKISPCSSDTMGAIQCSFNDLPSDKVTPRLVCYSDFATAIKTCRPTVSLAYMEKYKNFQ